MPPEIRGYEPEQQRPPEDPRVTAIKVQTLLLEKLPDDAARMRWVEENASRFRKMFDEDNAFHDLVMKGDVDAVEAALKGPLH